MDDTFVTVDGLRTRYWTAGSSGSPVVLLHGIGSSIEDWAKTIPALSASHMVYALDLAGCGLSDKPADFSYSPDAMRNHVLGFMDAVGIDCADINGWSMGGRIALDIASQQPERVRRLVLTAPAGIGQKTIFNFRMATLPFLGEVLTRPSKLGIQILMNAAVAKSSVISEEEILLRLSMGRMPGAQAAFLKQLRTFVGGAGFLDEPRKELLSNASNVKAPTLAIWGKQDKFVPPAHAKVLEETLESFRVETIDRCGHLPQIEHPEKYNALLTEFLA